MTNLISPEPSRMEEVIKYRQAGRQTRLNAMVPQLASMPHGTALDKTKQILEYLKSMKVTRFNEEIFRKRTAEQIIQEGYVTGCTDSDLVYVALARTSGLPAKYVETIDQSWLQEGGGSIRGHQYAEVYDNQQERWFWVDPMGMRIDIHPPTQEGRVIYGVGLDSWDIGITDFDSMQQKFETFRANWLQNKKI